MCLPTHIICDCFSIDIFCSKKQNQCKLDLKHDLEYVKDSFDVTPVHDHDDASDKAHKVILVALSFFLLLKIYLISTHYICKHAKPSNIGSVWDLGHLLCILDKMVFFVQQCNLDLILRHR